MSRKSSIIAMSAKGWQPDRPYNAMPPLPPAAEVETRAVLRACITARAALAELKQAAQLIPNQAMLVNTLSLLEARASSEIENLVTTTDELFRHAGNEAQANPATKEALRYGRALFEGFTALENNGRTGRVLNSLFLIEEGLLTLPILYLSRYIINHKADYCRLLLQVTRAQDWEPWLLYILHGVEETAGWTTAKIAAIRTLSERTAEYVRARLPKVYEAETRDSRGAAAHPPSFPPARFPTAARGCDSETSRQENDQGLHGGGKESPDDLWRPADRIAH